MQHKRLLQGARMITRRGFLKTIGALTLSGFASAAYAGWVEPMLLTRVKRCAFTPPNWSKAPDLRIAVLSDIHACRPWMTPERIRSIVADTSALKPDLIVLLGDYVSGMNMVTDYVHSSEWSAALSGLTAPLGVFAVLGNHDWWEDRTAQRSGQGPTIAGKALEAVGIPVLENKSIRLEKNGKGFWLSGLGDQIALLPGRGSGRTTWAGKDDLKGTLAQVDDDDAVMLLAHEPDIFPRVPQRVSLTLSGHTHGGQVRLFGWSPVVSSRFGNRYAYGHIEEGGRHLIVSGGLGMSIAPLRFGVRPEIVLLELGGQAVS